MDLEVTLSDYATRWVKDQAGQGLALATLANYEQMLRLYILPILGSHKVRALHRRQIRSWLASKREGGLSKNTVRLMRAALSSLLTDAVDDGILLANPCLGIGRKRKAAYKMGTAERQQHVRPMTEERLEKFLETALASRLVSRRSS